MWQKIHNYFIKNETKNILCHRSGSIFSKVCFCHGQAGEWPTEDYIKNFNLGKVTRDTILLTICNQSDYE